MGDADEPIAWTALRPGTPVLASDGEELGKVSSVVADEQKDIFSGVAFRSRMLERQIFAPADVIERITTGGVRLRLDSEQSERLGPYEA